MGGICELLGQHLKAEKAFREAITLRERLVAEFPGEASYRADLGWSYHSLGVALAHLGRPTESDKALRRCLDLWQALATKYPAAVWYRRWHLLVQQELADLVPADRHTGNEKALRQALPLLEAQARNDPGGKWRYNLTATYNSLGQLLSSAGQSKEAERFFRQAVEVQRELATEFPKRPDSQHGLAAAQQRLGNLLGTVGRPQEEEQLYRESIAILTKLVADFPHTPQFRAGLAATCLSLFS
jgi:tetratricopeptide (TPR) repeat protein